VLKNLKDKISGQVFMNAPGLQMGSIHVRRGLVVNNNEVNTNMPITQDNPVQITKSKR